MTPPRDLPPRDLFEVGQWVVSTCRLHGTEAATAFRVAEVFLRGIAGAQERAVDDWREEEAERLG